MTRDDLIARLRGMGDGRIDYFWVGEEAADEIERREAEVKRLTTERDEALSGGRLIVASNRAAQA